MEKNKNIRENWLMRDASAISRFGFIFMGKALKEHNVSGGDHGTIMFLSKHPQVNQDFISHRTMLDKATIAKSLARLEEQGLVMREVDPNNKRAKIISLTEEGQKIVNIVEDALDTWSKQVTEGLTEQEVQKFTALAAKIARNARSLVHEGHCKCD